jgi:hypothetical protein
VRKISTVEMRDLVERFHYLGKKKFRSSFMFGLFVNEKLMGAICFHSLSAPETAVGAFGLMRTDQKGFWEIGRLVLHPELNGGNFGSFFIAKAVKALQKETCSSGNHHLCRSATPQRGYLPCI